MSKITPDTTIREHLIQLIQSGQKKKAWQLFRNWFTPEDNGPLYWELVRVTEETTSVKIEVFKLTIEQQKLLERVEISIDDSGLLEILDVLEIDRTNVTNIEFWGTLNETTLRIERKQSE